jgi:hypothetical protein
MVDNCLDRYRETAGAPQIGYSLEEQASAMPGSPGLGVAAGLPPVRETTPLVTNITFREKGWYGAEEHIQGRVTSELDSQGLNPSI